MAKIRDLLVAAVILIVIWEVTALLIGSIALPQPWVVLADFCRKIWNLSLLGDFLISAFRALAGIFLALITGVPLGLIVGFEPWLRKRLSPFIYLLYPIPHIVFLPLIIILLGIGDLSKIFLVALVVFFQVLVTARDSAKNIHRNYYYSIKTLNASPWQIYRHLVLPATLPNVLTSMRISIGTAVAILFFAESFATTKGLGYKIMDAWGVADYVSLYSSVLAMALLGCILYLCLELLENRVCRWKAQG